MGFEADGEGFMVTGPDGVKRFEEDPSAATPAWRRAQALALERNARQRRN